MLIHRTKGIATQLLASILLTVTAFQANADESCRNLIDSILAGAQSDSVKLQKMNEIGQPCATDSYTRLKRAEYLAATGALNEAVKIVSAENRFGDYSEDADLLRARIYAMADKAEIAKQILREAIADHPGTARAPMLLGEILVTEGKTQEAFDNFIASLNADPTARAYRGAAVAAYKLGDCDQAITAIDQAIAMDQAATLKSRSTLIVGARCFTHQGKFRAATGMVTAILEADESALERKDVKDTVKGLRAAIREAQESGDTSTDADQITLNDADL